MAALERWLAALALASYRRRTRVLAAALGLLAISWLGIQRLRVDTDLTHLLPPSFASVKSLQALETRAWGVGYVAVVAKGGDPKALERFADEVAPRLEALPSVRYVDVRRPTAFFRERALYFLDREDLEAMLRGIEARREWEVRKRSPLYDLGLEDLGEPPPLDFGELREKYEGRAHALGAGGAGSDYLTDPDGRLIVLLAKPTRRSSDIGFNDQVVEEVQRFVDSLDTSAYGALEVELSGRYKKKYDQKRQIESDLRSASLLALALMVLYLAVHFRRPSAVGLVLGPLVVALAWTFGITGAVLGTLNLMTGFIGAVLLGLGIDHGIHLLSRFEEERLRGSDPESAIATAFGQTGRAVTVAASTTVFAFLGVAVSEFRAFREFGVIAAGGLVLVVLAYVTVLPALLSLRRRQAEEAPEDVRVSLFARAVPRWAPVSWWLTVLAAVAAVSFAIENRFDYDFASLEDSSLPSFQLDKRITQLLGRSQTPLVVVPQSPAEEHEIARALRAERERRGAESSVQMVMSLGDLVPEGQAEKRKLIEAIGREVEATRPEWLSEEQRTARAELLEMTRAEPFSRSDLPASVRRQFQTREGDVGMVLVFSRVSLSDGEGVRRLAAELSAARLADGAPLMIAGEAMVLADVLDMVVSEAPVVLGVTVLLVVLVLITVLGRRAVLPCVAVAMATLGVTAGLMPRVGIRFNYLNIVMIPVLFGIAVDGAVHFLARHHSDGDVVSATSETGRAIAGAILTTMLGFGAMFLADHPGLRSLAEVAVLGLAVNLLVSLVGLPSYLALAERGKLVRLREGRAGLWTRMAVTLGMAGDAPLAPGTLGALIAIPLGVMVQRLGVTWRAALVVILSALSVLVVARYLQKRGANKDPSEVVIDELVGCLIAIAMVPQAVGWIAAAFVLFRIFDIAKPWPIGFIDRRVRGALGVMGDDIAAGLFAGLLLAGLHRFGLTQGWWT